MGSREKILEAVKQSQTEEVELESYFPLTAGSQNLTSLFQTMLESIGGKCELVNGMETVNDFLQKVRSKGVSIVNAIEKSEGYNLDAYRNVDAKELSAVHTMMLKGQLGVAENGAVWVTEQIVGNRVLPFICEQLLLVLEEADIVETMHDAYQRITINEEGYGVFIAGPSKTADIEQSLVIGAHGPLSLFVLIIKK